MRAVCDTNVVVSALLFESGRCSWLREAWRTGAIVPIVDRRTAQELLRVLEYPEFRLSVSERDELLADYLPFAEIVTGAEELPDAQVERTSQGSASSEDPGTEGLRDPADQMFLDLALLGQADALITGDADLLVLADRLPFDVLTPAQARSRTQ